MQDHAYEIRQQYINDYAARVKLPPDEQRALWIDHLKSIRHPRMEMLTRREPVKVPDAIGGRAANFESDPVKWPVGIESEWSRGRDYAISEAIANAEKARAAREAWKEI